MSAVELRERRNRVLGRHAPLLYERPLQLVRGEGVWMFDETGRRYLDAYNNVPHVGHCHPRVTEALCQQARTLNTNTRYLDENIVNYSERLLATFDPSLANVLYCCSGSEANELALRIAREYTGGDGVISTAYAYHGNTATVIQISTAFTPPEKRASFVRPVPVMDPYRDREGRDDAALGDAYVRDVQNAIESLHRDGKKLAALLVCTAFSSEGLPNVPAGYLAKAARCVREAGGLVIADEVQAGFGRFGTHTWGHERLGATPDIVTLGKPMGNGHPLAGVVARADLVEYFTSRNLHFNTFGGNTVSCAVGLSVLDVIEKEKLRENARDVGAHLLERLKHLQTKHPIMGDVRGGGLFFAVDLVQDRSSKLPATDASKRVVNEMRERGVLISRIGPDDNILKIRPPLPFSKDNADLLVSTLDEVMADL